MDKRKAHASLSSTLPSRSKSPPPKPKLVNKLARPVPEKKRPAANKKYTAFGR